VSSMVSMTQMMATMVQGINTRMLTTTFVVITLAIITAIIAELVECLFRASDGIRNLPEVACASTTF